MNAAAERLNETTEQIIGCAIAVHQILGPGLLESAYEACLCYELLKRGLKVERQKPLALVDDAVALDCAYRMDLVVAGAVIVEVKSVARLGTRSRGADAFVSDNLAAASRPRAQLQREELDS